MVDRCCTHPRAHTHAGIDSTVKVWTPVAAEGGGLPPDIDDVLADNEDVSACVPWAATGSLSLPLVTQPSINHQPAGH